MRGGRDKYSDTHGKVVINDAGNPVMNGIEGKTNRYGRVKALKINGKERQEFEAYEDFSTRIKQLNDMTDDQLEKFAKDMGTTVEDCVYWDDVEDRLWGQYDGIVKLINTRMPKKED